MSFNYNEFVRNIHESVNTDLSLMDVSSLLKLKDNGYNLGATPTSGRGILLNRIIIEGQKNSSPFSYDKNLFRGLNLWVADNLKGKSTVFKAIRFALTGSNDISSQMKAWIRIIQLQFTTAQDTFSVCLYTGSKSLIAKIYKAPLDQIDLKEPIAELDNAADFKSYMQEFFFVTLNYYPLRRVKATQSSPELVDSDISWSMYFMAIYVQSKDYSALAFANSQGGIFQVLMGLPNTYAIHALEAREKKLNRELDLYINKSSDEEQTIGNYVNVAEQLKEIDIAIGKLRNDTTRKEITEVQHSINIISGKLESLRLQKSQFDQSQYDNGIKNRSLIEAIDNKKREVSEAAKEINSIQKKINRHKEHIEFGIFFSNLEVTECPHCENDVTKEKIRIEKESHKCMLCDHPIVEADIDTSAWQERISDMENELALFSQLKQKREHELSDLFTQQQILSKYSTSEGTLLQFEKQMEEQQILLSSHEAKLSELLSHTRDYFGDFEKLLQERFILESKMSPVSKLDVRPPHEVYKEKIAVLSAAKNWLIEDRKTQIEERLTKLENLMLKQIHNLGLASFTRIEINRNNFNIYYYQNEIKNKFADISEGEQLRAKLALYLSMIEMALSLELAKHPRLIILDSPSKEEGDQSFVEGLKEALKSIAENFGDQIQILIGTANRNLEDTIPDGERKVIIPAEQFLF